MQNKMIKLIIVTVIGEYIETEYNDIETARSTGLEWLQKGWARGFSIEQ